MNTIVFAVAAVLLINLTTAQPVRPDNQDDVDSSRLEELLSRLNDKGTDESEYERSDTPGHAFWNELMSSLPNIREYLENLDNCVVAVRKLKLIEENFYYVEGDEDNLQQSRATLCRLAMVLHDVLSSAEKEQSQEYNPSPNTVDKRVFDKISHGGPVPFKRTSESKRVYNDWDKESRLYKRSESLDELAEQLGGSMKKR